MLARYKHIPLCYLRSILHTDRRRLPTADVSSEDEEVDLSIKLRSNKHHHHQNAVHNNNNQQLVVINPQASDNSGSSSEDDEVILRTVLPGTPIRTIATRHQNPERRAFQQEMVKQQKAAEMSELAVTQASTERFEAERDREIRYYSFRYLNN